MQGRSFRSICETGKEPADWKQAAYYRYWMHMAHHDNPGEMAIRTKTHKLIYFYGCDYDGENQTPPGWELYDLVKDPDELNNVYDDPAYAAVRDRLKTQFANCANSRRRRFALSRVRKGGAGVLGLRRGGSPRRSRSRRSFSHAAKPCWRSVNRDAGNLARPRFYAMFSLPGMPCVVTKSAATKSAVAIACDQSCLMRISLNSAHIGLPACSCSARTPASSACLSSSVKSMINRPFR